MAPRIAIPVPTSFDPEYNDRSWPQYARAVERAGGEPVAIPLDDAPAATAKLIASCTGILLPGSGADVNPQKYGQALHPAAAPPDPARENVDELLLQDAHNMGKPLLAICFGTQILNVWRGGSIVQDVPSALPSSPVNHKAGRDIRDAHAVDIAPHSLLAHLLEQSGQSEQQADLHEQKNPDEQNESVISTQVASLARDAAENLASPPLLPTPLPTPSPAPTATPTPTACHSERSEEPPHFAPAQSPFLTTSVNSSHHQAIDAPGDGLFITARSSDDGVIEAIEGGHGPLGASPWDRSFLLGVQWHPERTCDHSALSRAIFSAFIAAVIAWTPRPVTTSVG